MYLSPENTDFDGGYILHTPLCIYKKRNDMHRILTALR